MTPEPNRPDEREAAIAVLTEMRALGMPPCVFAHAAEEIAALDLAIAILRHDAPREGAEVACPHCGATACPKCDGKGWYGGNGYCGGTTCSDCNGNGTLADRAPREGGEADELLRAVQRFTRWYMDGDKKDALTEYHKLLTAQESAERHRPQPTGETCKTCGGRGWTEEGDPEVGHAPFDCAKCGGTGEGAPEFVRDNGATATFMATACPDCAPSDAPERDAVGALVERWDAECQSLARGEVSDYSEGQRHAFGSAARELAAALQSRPVVDERFVLIEREAVENFSMSTNVPRFQRMCAAALRAPEQQENERGNR